MTGRCCLVSLLLTTTNGACVRLGFDQTGSAQTSGPENVIMVTTADDEDDIGTNLPTVETAGGVLAVSLREAIEIANASPTPSVIRFDSVVFPPMSPATILLAQATGDLPPITRAGIQIDGSDAGVTVDGRNSLTGVGLRVEAGADGFSLTHITLQGFSGPSPACLETDGAAQVHVLDSTFYPDDATVGPAVRIVGGHDHVISRNQFRSPTTQYNYQPRLRIEGTAANVTIEDNRFGPTGTQAAGGGIYISGTNHRIAGNEFTDLYYQGIDVAGTDSGNIVIENNLFHHLNYGGCCEALRVMNGARDISIRGNTFEEAKYVDIRVAGAATTRVAVAQNTFSSFSESHVRLDSGANEGVLPPAITSFDGQHVQGTAGAEGAEVEIYAARSVWTRLGAATVTAGTWSFDCGAPQVAVAAHLTTASGSSSEFAGAVRADDGSLIVTTLDDELDGGAGIVSMAEAGGADDLSLREAMVIANNRYGPDTITFSSAIFPAGVEKTIKVADGWNNAQPLPPIVDRYTTIDGGDAVVVLDCSNPTFSSGSRMLEVRVDHVTLSNIRLQDFNPGNGNCLYAYDVRYLEVSGCSFVRCGDTGGGDVVSLTYVSNSDLSGNQVQRASSCVFTHGNSLTTFSGNEISYCDQAGIRAVNTQSLVLSDNSIHDCAGQGILLDQVARNVLILGNKIWANGDGIRVSPDANQHEIYFNTLVGNSVGVNLQGAVSGIQLINNISALNLQYGIQVGDQAQITAHHQLFFDNGGDALSGTRAFSSLGRLGATDVLADPAFTDTAGGDFTPSAGAIDRGVDLGYDRNGALQGSFNGVAPDIGAIETP
jgi:nitrous oxidase accessory protein NosD